MRNPQTISVDEESLAVPIWSILAAAAFFALIEYYVWTILPRHYSTLPPLGMRVYFNISWGILGALYFLMIGFVSKDAPRRGMSPHFWGMLCLVMPCGIGAVLYFLLRSPLLSRCPACGTHIQNDFHFCPQCNCPLEASCGNCFRTVRATDHFCTRCGHSLDQEQMPSQLHVSGE